MPHPISELVRIEQAAGAQSLGFVGSPVAWWEVVAGAQAALSDAHISLRSSLEGPNGAAPLLSSAARMLDAASRPTSDLPGEERRRIALLALQAFSMDGNTPAAMAMAARFPDLLTSGTPNELVSVATALPAQVGPVLRTMEPGPQREYLEVLNFFLESGGTDLVDTLENSLRSLILNHPTSLESLLLSGSINTLRAISRYSVAIALRPRAGPFLGSYVDRLVTDGIRTLLPPQIEALDDADILGSQNAVVAIPTGTGKTLLAELALLAGLEAGPGLVCYVAPYVALGRQVATTLRRRARGLARIHPMIGGYRLPRPLEPATNREIAVCTPERFDALLRLFPELHQHLRVVVVDEAHLVGNGVRGARLEGIVARLRLRQSAGQGSRVVFLSAVVPNPRDLAGWLGPPTAVATSSWRPSTRRTVFWGEDGQLRLLVGDDRLRRPEQSAATLLGAQPLPWPNASFYPTSNLGQQLAQLPKAYENVAYLVRFLLARDEGSVLVICGSRKGTRALARSVSDQLPRVEPTPPRVGRLIARIRSRYPYLRSLLTALESGVAYHNAALPNELRELVEEAVRHGELSSVVATTTLAEGVDLPFRFTVLADWLVPTESGQRPMDPLLFRNIAGRSGRAGWHTEGVTVVYDNVVGTPSLVAPQTRRDLQRQVFASDSLPPLESIFSGGSTSDDGEEAAAVVASNYLAAVPENPSEHDLGQALYEHSLASMRPDGERLLRLLEKSRVDLLEDGPHGPFAAAASPLVLTTLGAAANVTGLSPVACRAIVDMLDTFDPTEEPPARVAANVLHRLLDVPEQTNVKLRRRLAGANNKYPIESGDLQPLIAGWIGGEEEDQLFRRLGFVQRSSRKPGIDDWLAGVAESPTWPDVFDQFIDFRSVTLAGFLPWVLRACASLSDVVDPAKSAFDWALLADFVETGTSNRWAATAVGEGAPGARRVAIAIGAAFDDLDLPPDDPLGLVLCRVSPQVVTELFARVAASLDEELVEDQRALFDWLFERATFG